MTTTHVEEPELPDGITPGELDEEARRDLRGLQKDTADVVAKHLVAAGMLVDEDPERALAHARYARRRASRIAVVREAAGIVAYHAGEWNEALGELRAARRMGGGPVHLAVMADIERALGRPERALELVRDPAAKELGKAETIELVIVAAGARRDLGELDAAVVGLQIPELEPTRRDPWSPRLFYAYADNLLAAGRESDALQWFVHTVDADVDGETDADERIAELTGEPIDDGGVTFQGEDELEPADADFDADAADVDDDAEADDADGGTAAGEDPITDSAMTDTEVSATATADVVADAGAQDGAEDGETAVDGPDAEDEARDEVAAAVSAPGTGEAHPAAPADHEVTDVEPDRAGSDVDTVAVAATSGGADDVADIGAGEATAAADPTPGSEADDRGANAVAASGGATDVDIPAPVAGDQPDGNDVTGGTDR